jgi:holo-[acyl-carrier protein] synthase
LILGLGIDIIEVPRIATTIERHGSRFLEKVFLPSELLWYERKRSAAVEDLAGRFAAKEAMMKALGTGWRRGVQFRQIEVLNERSGKPTIRLSGRTLEVAEALGVEGIHVSISHERTHAVAVVVLEGASDAGSGDSPIAPTVG